MTYRVTQTIAKDGSHGLCLVYRVKTSTASWQVLYDGSEWSAGQTAGRPYAGVATLTRAGVRAIRAAQELALADGRRVTLDLAFWPASAGKIGCKAQPDPTAPKARPAPLSREFVTIYYDTQDPQSKGWAWRSRSESGPVTGRTLSRALSRYARGHFLNANESRALDAAFPGSYMIDAAGFRRKGV